MKCSELISELSQQMARSGDLDVEIDGTGTEPTGVVRLGRGAILITTNDEDECEDEDEDDEEEEG